MTMTLHSDDRALLERAEAKPSAGDVVVLVPRASEARRRFGENRYVIGVVYAEATDGRPYLLLRENRGATAGVVAWFEMAGRVGASAVEVIERGTWASRVDFWKERYPW